VLTREHAVTLKQNKMETTAENLRDAFKEWMESIYWEGVLETMQQPLIDFSWNQFLKMAT